MRVLAIAALVSFGLCGRTDGETRSVRSLAAANLNAVFQTLGPQFEAETGVHPVFSFASTAQLAAQIDNGAPFDVFAAADTRARGFALKKIPHPAGVARGLRDRHSRALDSSRFPRQRLEAGLPLSAQPGVKVIALSEARTRSLWTRPRERACKSSASGTRSSPRIVYADNINMAKQYGSSGNADAGSSRHIHWFSKKAAKSFPWMKNCILPSNRRSASSPPRKIRTPRRRSRTWLLTGRGRDGLRAFGYKVAR